MSGVPRRSSFVWLVLLLCAVYASLFAWVAVVTVRYYGTVKAPGWHARATDDGWFVSLVEADGAAAGTIAVGDRLVALDGDERAAVLGTLLFDNVPGGHSYRVDLERHGSRLSVELPLPLVRSQLLWPLFQLVGLAFFVCGAALALLRPADPQVRLVGGALMAVAFSTLLEAEDPARRFITSEFDRLVQLAIVAASLFTFPMAFHFFSRFPTWTSPGRLWRGLQWLLYALLALVFLPAWIISYLASDVTAGTSRFLVSHRVLFVTASQISARPVFVYIAACLLLSVFVVARNYRRLPDPDSRRRIRLVVAGLIAGCIPFLAVYAFAYRIFALIDEAAFRFWYPVTFISMLCIPASIATAVWKEQLFDVRVLVRSGLQYLFARAALRTLLALPIIVLAFSIFAHPNRTIVQILTQGSGWINVALIGAIAVALQSRQRLQTSLDRRFFREAYEQEQVLMHLIEEVRQRDSLSDVATLVGARVDAVLHPASLHIFYRAQERSDRFDGHSSSRMVTGAQLSAQQSLLRLLDGDKTIRDVPAGVEGALPDEEREWLAKLGVRLIVPIAGTRDRLVGVLLLGERKSEEPYSATDRRLLQGLAVQIGLVYENQHLQERIRLDADVRRDVLARLDDRRVTLLKECPRCGRCFDGTSDRCETDGAELALTLPIERTLEGKYRLDRALGRGGFGAVYEAADLRLHRQVAAKVMIGSLFGDQTALRRFEREARAAAKIDHPHITRVHDYGTIGSGGAYLIMELVGGRTWRAELQRSANIAPARASEWFRQLLDGLQFAHAMGIVHRDLKPENVMIVQGPADIVKIMDFGLAKVLDSGTGATESVSVAGTAMGTIGYMAPEALTGGVVDERADIFAIGVMVVETFTGVRPFTGQTMEQALAALLHSEYHLPGTSAEIRMLDAIVQRCIAKDPRDRYGSAAELATDLIPVLAGRAVLRAPTATAAADTPTLGPIERSRSS
jgi:tRNA A-37 threonylcarbamoyl transferase component Bud32/GAF domain-containing protein